VLPKLEPRVRTRKGSGRSVGRNSCEFRYGRANVVAFRLILLQNNQVGPRRLAFRINRQCIPKPVARGLEVAGKCRQGRQVIANKGLQANLGGAFLQLRVMRPSRLVIPLFRQAAGALIQLLPSWLPGLASRRRGRRPLSAGRRRLRFLLLLMPFGHGSTASPRLVPGKFLSTDYADYTD
jgi:hypothetical protein